MEPETWLARKLRVIARPLGDRKNGLLGMPLPVDYPLSLPIGQYVPAEVPEGKTVPEVFSENEDSMSVVDAVRRHFDPLPGFIRDLAGAIISVSNDEDEEATTANLGVFRWVRRPLASVSKDPTVQFVRSLVQRAQRRHGEFGRSHEDDAHGHASFPGPRSF